MPFNLRFFGNGDGGDAGTQGVETGTQETADASAQANQTQGTNQQENQLKQAENQTQLSAEAIDRLIQSRVDRITAELGKKNSSLQKELDKLKKEKLSDEERNKAGIDSLPGSLEEAIKEAEADPFIKEVLGEHVFNNYIEGKREEWNSYKTSVSQWEINRYMINY